MTIAATLINPVEPTNLSHPGPGGEAMQRRVFRILLGGNEGIHLVVLLRDEIEDLIGNAVEWEAHAIKRGEPRIASTSGWQKGKNICKFSILVHLVQASMQISSLHFATFTSREW